MPALEFINFLDIAAMKKITRTVLLSAGIACVQPYAFASDEALKEALQDCTKIASALERLNCFDKVAQTPAIIPEQVQPRAPTSYSLSIVERVLRNEENRSKDDMQFLISEADEYDSEGRVIGSEVIISAPAMGGRPDSPQSYLAVSCILNITRLQLITHQPVQKQFVRVQLLMDGRPTGSSTMWQVLDSGKVIDSGRGLVAIDLLRRLGNGQRLSIKSDDPMFDGIYFDATGLSNHIQTERRACHW